MFKRDKPIVLIGRSRLRLFRRAGSEASSSPRVVNMPSHPFAEYRDTPAWRVIEASINELMVVGDVSINTATDHAIGFLCHELVSAKLIVSTDSEP